MFLFTLGNTYLLLQNENYFNFTLCSLNQDGKTNWINAWNFDSFPSLPMLAASNTTVFIAYQVDQVNTWNISGISAKTGDIEWISSLDGVMNNNTNFFAANDNLWFVSSGR